MLFLMSFFIFNFSYLFGVMFLVFFIMYSFLFVMNFIMYVKFLVILVYVSGVVVFVLYISCLCWNSSFSFSFLFLIGGLFCSSGTSMSLMSKFSDIGEHLWMYLFFSLIFNVLVMNYSLNLFKVSGSLRF